MITSPITRPITSRIASAIAGARQGGAPVWSPANLFASSEQGAWYDPSDLSTLFQDSAGTTPVTATGQPVGKMLDKSGNGNHAIQTTSSKRPLYQEAGGLSYLLFDGVDDTMVTTASVDFTGTDKISLSSGCIKTSSTAGMILELSPNAGSISYSGTFYSVVGNDIVDGVNELGRGSAVTTGLQIAVKSVSNGTTIVKYVTHDISGDISTVRINAVAGTNATADKGAGNFGNYKLHIGSRNQTSLYYDSKLYSLVIRGSLSSDSERDSLEQWVASKTGVTL